MGTMKTRLLSSLMIVSLAATAAFAKPPGGGRGPAIDGQVTELEKKVQSDLTSGALTKPDADELKRELDQVHTTMTNEPSLTEATRRDLREKLSKIRHDLQLKESLAKGLASPSATP